MQVTGSVVPWSEPCTPAPAIDGVELPTEVSPILASALALLARLPYILQDGIRKQFRHAGYRRTKVINNLKERNAITTAEAQLNLFPLRQLFALLLCLKRLIRMPFLALFTQMDKYPALTVIINDACASDSKLEPALFTPIYSKETYRQNSKNLQHVRASRELHHVAAAA